MGPPRGPLVLGSEGHAEGCGARPEGDGSLSVSWEEKVLREAGPLGTACAGGVDSRAQLSQDEAGPSLPVLAPASFLYSEL